MTVCPLGAVGAWPPRQTALSFPGRVSYAEGTSLQARPLAASGGFMSPSVGAALCSKAWRPRWEGGSAPLESSSEGPEGRWPQKRLGLRWASRPDTRQQVLPPHHWAPPPGPVPAVTSVSLHPPQSQGSLRALTPPSLHLHTSCDRVLTASQAARPDTQSRGCQERELFSKC